MITNNNCTGCGACSESCPHSCISMTQNKIGELIPLIDRTRCVECGICRKICPQNQTIPKTMPKKCYVAWSHNESDWIYSASGGAMPAMARLVLKKGGAVYGCDYNAHGYLEHYCAENEHDISRFQSSKYSRSNAFVVFKEIRAKLQTDQTVLFVGTPCQVAGLKSFLKKTYDNLITVDLVCHGTPPNIYLQQHIRALRVKQTIDKIRFRGEYDQKLTLWSEESIVYQNQWKEDSYFHAFYDNMISYNSCYECPYAKAERVSDITIGDFWGIGKLRTITEKSKRPSLILVNTARGAAFFEDFKDQLFFEEREVAEGIRGNGRLNNSPGKNSLAKCFQVLYPVFGFEYAIKISRLSVSAASHYRRAVRYLKRLIRKMKRTP